MESDDRAIRDGELATTEAKPRSPSLFERVAATLARRPEVLGTTYILLDLSASMGDEGKLPQLRQGAIRFYAEAWKLGYAVGAIGFSRQAWVLQPATRDFSRFQRCLTDLQVDGRTAMASAIRLATRKLRNRSGDRAILLITDGMPDSREATLDAAREARALGITLVAVGTHRADQAFLASLTGLPELARHVGAQAFADGIGGAAMDLPHDLDPQR